MKAGQSIVPSLDDPRLAGHGRTPDGLQILIQPEETPEERKALLNAMADASANDLAVQDTASSLLWAAQEKVGRKLTTKEALQALLDGIYQLVEYLPDPDSMLDFYQPAELTLMSVPGQPVSALTGQPRGTGDCEDTSVLFASLVLAAARTGVFRDVTDHADPPAPRVEWLSQPGKPQNHVAAVACTHECAANDPECPDGCWWVETTLPGARIGEHPYVALERLGGRHRIEGVTRPTSAPSAAVTTGSIYLPSGEGGPENAPSGTGTIRVDGLAGQIVTLDGRAVSVLPGGTIVSPVGRHTLGVQSMGSASQVRVFVAEGATTWVELSTGANGSLTLRPAWGRLIVANWVPRSHLFLSSFPTGASEADYSTATNVGGRLDIGLPLGTMHVSITTPRGETRTASGVRLSRSAPALLDWNTMAASHGAGIVIQNMPHGGITFIDGSRTNDANSRWLDSAMTRWFIPYVLDGVHTIRVDAHGQSRQVQSILPGQVDYNRMPAIGGTVPSGGPVYAAQSTYGYTPTLHGHFIPGHFSPTGDVAAPSGPRRFIALTSMPHGSVPFVGSTPVSGRWVTPMAWVGILPVSGTADAIITLVSPGAKPRVARVRSAPMTILDAQHDMLASR